MRTTPSRQTLRTVTALATAILLAACGGDDSETPTEVQFESVSWQFLRPFAAGTYVVRTEAELNALWSSTPFVEYPFVANEETPRPTYDFTKYMVVGISSGAGNYYCNSPNVIRATQTSSTLRIQYSVPTGTTGACRYPGPRVGFALVPKFAGQVLFDEVK